MSRLLEVSDLVVEFTNKDQHSVVVDSITFSLEKGKTLALVGESGSGKSVTALSILQLLPYPIASHSLGSSILFKGKEIIGMHKNGIRNIRGSEISMIFQEPMTSLNPFQRVGSQIEETLIVHKNSSKRDAREKTLSLLDRVKIFNPESKVNSFPHQLSGGQRQRIMIAMALANEPDLLIADEPTTALDVTVEKTLLDLLLELKRELKMSILFITHDLNIVKKFADEVCIMEKGKIVEKGKVNGVFAQPEHQYTKRLLNSLLKPKEEVFNKRDILLEAKDINIKYLVKRSIFKKRNTYLEAVKDVNIEIHKGFTTGLVGESGSGKSSLARALLGLEKNSGIILFEGKDLKKLSKKSILSLKKYFQIVFQDPFGSLSPRLKISEIIGEGLRVHETHLNKEEREERILKSLEEVDLSESFFNRFPHELSGGQRQRIAIARAIILKPKLILLDEPTSALDVSIQMQIIKLLSNLQEKFGLSYLCISHDLRVIRALSDLVYVMLDGRIVEYGKSEQIFNKPSNPYTIELLSGLTD